MKFINFISINVLFSVMSSQYGYKGEISKGTKSNSNFSSFVTPKKAKTYIPYSDISPEGEKKGKEDVPCNNVVAQNNSTKKPKTKYVPYSDIA